MANAKTNTASVSRSCKEINHTSKSSHFVAIFKRFYEMKTNMDLCDITLKAENVTFSAHRLVLAGNSLYFQNIFRSENTEIGDYEVILPNNVRCESVRSMLDYFYTGELHIKGEDCEEMLSLACLLQVRYILSKVLTH